MNILRFLMVSLLLAFISLAFVFPQLSNASDPLDAWTSRTSGTSVDLNGATFASGTFFVVGSAGIILTSPDGITWKSRASGSTHYLNGATRASGTFVIVGDSGTILTSSD